MLKAQGSFFVGGEKAEQTQVELGGLGPGGHITVNQMYVRYMVPQGGDGNVPVVMVHGATLTGTAGIANDFEYRNNVVDSYFGSNRRLTGSGTGAAAKIGAGLFTKPREVDRVPRQGATGRLGR